jgi:hypothetical protein
MMMTPLVYLMTTPSYAHHQLINAATPHPEIDQENFSHKLFS